MKRTINPVTFYNRPQVIINTKLKTFTHFWLEDYVDEASGNVYNKVKSEIMSYAGVSTDNSGLERLFYVLNVPQSNKSTKVRTTSDFSPYKIIK